MTASADRAYYPVGFGFRHDWGAAASKVHNGVMRPSLHRQTRDSRKRELPPAVDSAGAFAIDQILDLNFECASRVRV